MDGAFYLREHGWEEVACLVAHHSQARLLSVSLRAFPRRLGVAQDLVDYADARTGPEGQVVTIEERLAEIGARHGAASPAGQVIERRRTLLLALSRRIDALCGYDPLV